MRDVALVLVILVALVICVPLFLLVGAVELVIALVRPRRSRLERLNAVAMGTREWQQRGDRGHD